MELIANAAPVQQFLAYLDHVGMNERDLQIGYIDRRLRTSAAPAQVSARLIVELMEAAAEKAGRPDFGLQFVEWLNPRGFGALSLMWEHCRSLAERYRIERRYIHLENNAVLYGIAREGTEVALVQDVLPVLRPRATQFLNALVALSVRTTREMLGPSWNPVRVELAGPKPPGVSYRPFFHCDIEFGSARYAVIVLNEDFERRLPRGNPDMLAFMESHLSRRALNWRAEIEEQVAHLVAAELAGAAPTLNQIATLLAMAPRTLQRRLNERGTNFGAVLKSVRLQIVQDYAGRTPQIPLSRLAYELGYSEPSAASRFVKQELGALARRAPRKSPVARPRA